MPLLVLGLEKNIVCFLYRSENSRVDRSVTYILFDNYFGQKCVFYACFTLIWGWEGVKNFGVGIFMNKNLLG